MTKRKTAIQQKDATEGMLQKSREGYRLGDGNAGRNDRHSRRTRAPEYDGQGHKTAHKAVLRTVKKQTKKAATKRSSAVKRDRRKA